MLELRESLAKRFERRKQNPPGLLIPRQLLRFSDVCRLSFQICFVAVLCCLLLSLAPFCFDVIVNATYWAVCCCARVNTMHRICFLEIRKKYVCVSVPGLFLKPKKQSHVFSSNQRPKYSLTRVIGLVFGRDQVGTCVKIGTFQTGGVPFV